MGVGVKVTEYTWGLLGSCVKLLSVPPVTTMSLMSKLVVASLTVKTMRSVVVTVVMPVVAPTRSTSMVGAVVSVLTDMVIWLLASSTVPLTKGT